MNTDDVTGSPMAPTLIEMNEAMWPFAEAAMGFRRRLEEQGWSPTAAEAIAGQLLQRYLAMAFAAMATALTPTGVQR